MIQDIGDRRVMTSPRITSLAIPCFDHHSLPCTAFSSSPIPCTRVIVTLYRFIIPPSPIPISIARHGVGGHSKHHHHLGPNGHSAQTSYHIHRTRYASQCPDHLNHPLLETLASAQDAARAYKLMSQSRHRYEHGQSTDGTMTLYRSIPSWSHRPTRRLRRLYLPNTLGPLPEAHTTIRYRSSLLILDRVPRDGSERALTARLFESDGFY